MTHSNQPQVSLRCPYCDMKMSLGNLKLHLPVQHNLMTGQEWYERYQHEKDEGSLDNLKDMPHSKDYSDGIDHAVIKCDEAAERAALLRGEGE